MRIPPFRRWLRWLVWLFVVMASVATSEAVRFQSLQITETAWRMFGHDAARTGQTPVTGPQSGSLINWFRLANGESSWTNTFWFAAVDENNGVYFGDATGVTALSADNTVRWRRFTGAPTRAAALGADGTLYAGLSNRLIAFSADGVPQWAYRPSDGSAILGDDRTIYTIGNQAVHALMPDGTLAWKTTVPGDHLGPPAIGPTGALYVTAITDLCSIDVCFPDDSQLFEIDPATGSATLLFTYEAAALGAPVIAPDGTIYLVESFWRHELLALSPAGALLWTHDLGAGANAPPAIGVDGTIYVASMDANLYAVAPDGTRRWAYPTDDSSGGSISLLTSPVVGGDGTIYFGTQLGVLYALDPSGTVKWSTQRLGGSTTSPSIGPDGTLYVGVIRSRADLLLAFGGAAE